MILESETYLACLKYTIQEIREGYAIARMKANNDQTQVNYLNSHDSQGAGLRIIKERFDNR